MAISLLPLSAGYQGFTVNGIPNAGGLINTYLAGTTTPTATYTDSGGGTQNANPIVLGSDGFTPAEIWGTNGLAYKYVITDSLGQNAKTYDNLYPLQNAAFTYTQGTFTITLTGGTTVPTGTAMYTLIGNQVTIDIPNFTFTSNSVNKTLTGLPAALQPPNVKNWSIVGVDNTAASFSGWMLLSGGVFTLSIDGGGNPFTNVGTWILRGPSITYTLT